MTLQRKNCTTYQMINIEKKYPFGVNKSNFLYYIFAAIVILALLLLIDAPVTIFVENLPDYIIAPFKIITRAGNSDWILIPTLLGSIIGLIASKLNLAQQSQNIAKKLFFVSIFIFSSVAIPGIIANLIKRSLGRARPFYYEEYGVLHFEPFRDWTFQSFPSGDTTTIFALFVALTFLVPKYKYLFLLGAIMVGLSRIMVGVHFPTDVFGGFLLGIFGAYAVRNYFVKKGWQ